MPPSPTVPLSPDDRRGLDNLAALLNTGRGDEALRQAETLLAGGLHHPLPLGIAAAARQRVGRFDEAVALFQRRAELMAGDANGWAALAACLFAARRPEAALETWDKALTLAPTDAAMLSAKASVLQSLSRTDEARTLFERALAVAPNLFNAQFGLATIALEAGDAEGASRASARLMASHSEHPGALWMAARIALNGREFAAADAYLVKILTMPTLGADQRADALLMRGEALDGFGRAQDAFSAAADGKRLQRQLFAERAAGRERETDKMNRLADWFGRTDPAPWRAAPPAAPVPGEAATHVFLVGFPRSGTTLLEQVLAGHPDVVALEEAPTLADPYAEFMTAPADLERLARLSADEAVAWRARYWADVGRFGVQASGKVFLDKAPAGTLYLPLIAKLFPKAKVLFAIRDPRDVVLSCFRNSFQMNAMTYAFTDLAETAACYSACMRMSEVYREVLPLDLYKTRHEALVGDFGATLAEICGFLGIEPTAAMVDIAAISARRTVRTPSASQVREGLNTRGLARWRGYERELAPVMGTLASWVARFGYSPD